MKASELRINNWIKDGNDFEQITIYHLDCLIIGRCEFDPIPLTEEWLLKFGFEKCLNQFKKATGVNKGNYNNIPFIILYLDNEFQYDDLRFRTNLQYVHQLQNLYFALTNEELTYEQQK